MSSPMGLNAFGAAAAGVELLDCESEDHSLIRFMINHYQDDDETEKTVDEVVPFQVAYAVSIHKAQGLEYQSVKVVGTNELEETGGMLISPVFALKFYNLCGY